jgi:hypothetical protein
MVVWTTNFTNFTNPEGGRGCSMGVVDCAWIVPLSDGFGSPRALNVVRTSHSFDSYY